MPDALWQIRQPSYVYARQLNDIQQDTFFRVFPRVHPKICNRLIVRSMLGISVKCPEEGWNRISVHSGREATGKKKKDKPSILKICPVWLLNQDLNLGPSD